MKIFQHASHNPTERFRTVPFDNKPGGEEKTLLPGAPLVAIGAQKHDSIPVSKCQLFQILFINCSSNGGGPH